VVNRLAPAYCPKFQHAAETIGRRWSGVIVRGLLAGKIRFGELQELVPGLSPRLLSERLKELEAAGIIERHVIPATPIRVEYHLTEAGRELAGVVRALSQWADRWVD
jgi:DNA-binding HxlR family transcriptional regulator